MAFNHNDLCAHLCLGNQYKDDGQPRDHAGLPQLLHHI